MLVKIINGRGSFGEDAQTFLEGCQMNYKNYIADIKEVIEFIGENLSENISVYAKGANSSFVSLLLNIDYPYLFTSSVLHVL